MTKFYSKKSFLKKDKNILSLRVLKNFSYFSGIYLNFFEFSNIFTIYYIFKELKIKN